MGKVAELKKRTNGRSAIQAVASVDRPSRPVAEDAVRTLIAGLVTTLNAKDW